MKKLLLASAIAALTVSAQAAPTVYGKADLDVRYQEDGDVTLDNGSSRLGVKGSTPMTSTLDAIYKLEWAVDLDNDGNANDKNNFRSRDTYLGVQGDTFGTLKAGHMLTFDDAINVASPSDYWNSGVLGYDAKRYKNALVYQTPNYDGLSLMGMYKFTDEGDGGEQSNKADGQGSFGVGGAYNNGPLAAGLTYHDFKDLGDKQVDNAIRFSAGVDVTPELNIAGLYQVAEFNGKANSEKENAYIVSASYDIPASKWDVYAEYDAVTDKGGVKGADKNAMSVGGNYAFSKALSGGLYAGYTDIDDGNDDNDKFGVGSRLTYNF